MKTWIAGFLLVFCSFYSAVAQCGLEVFVARDGRVLLSPEQTTELVRMLEYSRPYFTASFAESSEIMTFEIINISGEFKNTMNTQLSSVELIIDTYSNTLCVLVSKDAKETMEFRLSLIDQTV